MSDKVIADERTVGDIVGWNPDCCDPPCVLMRMASLSVQELLDYALDEGNRADMAEAHADALLAERSP
jgi:hypothetical protein